MLYCSLRSLRSGTVPTSALRLASGSEPLTSPVLSTPPPGWACAASNSFRPALPRATRARGRCRLPAVSSPASHRSNNTLLVFAGEKATCLEAAPARPSPTPPPPARPVPGHSPPPPLLPFPSSQSSSQAEERDLRASCSSSSQRDPSHCTGQARRGNVTPPPSRTSFHPIVASNQIRGSGQNLAAPTLRRIYPPRHEAHVR
jgi:hypothetical protein